MTDIWRGEGSCYSNASHSLETLQRHFAHAKVNNPYQANRNIIFPNKFFNNTFVQKIFILGGEPGFQLLKCTYQRLVIKKFAETLVKIGS